MCDIIFDELGPSKVIHFYFHRPDFKAIVVIDNVALGPAVGGIRMLPTVTLGEVLRLARAMTMKNSAAGLPHGGAKSGIIADPKSPDKERIIRLFARKLKDLAEYIPGPDMGTNEESMAWVYDETGRASGLPEELGGLPLDKLGATGFGLSECAEVACPYAGISLKGARLSVQGYGSVGRAAARFLARKGAVLVGASDTKAAVYNPDGIDVTELEAVKESTGSLADYKKGIIKKPDEIFSFDCDILIPAAAPDVIHKGNMEVIKARLILEGANIPATLEAEEALASKGVVIVPDFIANAGGVTMAAMEYAKRPEKETFEIISSKIKANTSLILERAKTEGILPRLVAERIAKERVLKAMRYREM